MKHKSYVVNYPSEAEEKSDFWRRAPQYLAASAVTVGGFSLGNCLGYSSPALPNLKNSGDFPDIETSHLSWIGSLVTIGALCGACVSGYLVGEIGRKKTMLLVGLPFTVGWLTIAVAQFISMLYVGRFLTGFGVGALSLVAPVYLSEISHSDIRGFLGAIFQVTVTFGILFTFIVGSQTSWDVLAGICGVVPMIFIACTYFLPESPRYLLTNGQTNQAVTSLSWLRSCDPLNPSKAVLEEIDEIQGSISLSEEMHRCNNNLRLSNLINFPVLKPLMITLGLMFFNQFCGANAVGFYTVSIFEETGLGLNAYLSSIIVGIVQVVATALASAFVDKAGRRVLLLFSFATMAISLLSLGAFFRIKYEHKNSNFSPAHQLLEDSAWVPLASVVAFNAAYCGGVGCLVWTVMSEILPNHVIGFASGLATTFNWALAFLTTKFFHDLNDSLGIHNTFWLFTAACVLGLFFIFIAVPETKGMSLDRIQKENFQQQILTTNNNKTSVKDANSVTGSTADLV